MAKILGVGSVFIRSPDPDGLFAWYSRCLGSDALESPAPQGSAAIDTNKLLLWSIVDGDPNSLEYGRRDFTFNLIVDDVDAALREIEDAGGTVVGEAENGAKGRFGLVHRPRRQQSRALATRPQLASSGVSKQSQDDVHTDSTTCDKPAARNFGDPVSMSLREVTHSSDGQ